MFNTENNDAYFLNSRTADKWRRIGTKRRAGVAVPLYSVYSAESTGIGELTDIKLLAEWCIAAGISIIQLLPLNDVGSDFAPYNSVSSFAIDPMYITIKDIQNADIKPFLHELERLKKKYKPHFRRVNYKIKQAKIDLLWRIYKSTKTDDIAEYNYYKSANEYWLNDYSLYKVISELNPDTGWQNWDDGLKNRELQAIDNFQKVNFERIEFHKWMQWQLYEQLKEVKQFLEFRNILLLGDLPFLVSRESADVWSHPAYFMLQLSSGAPPDMYFAMGQKWGMPPYEWNNIANDGFIYVKEKLKYAENFYDMYRIDHFVGLFRVWVSPVDDYTTPGSYMPKEEYLWEPHGRRIIEEMVNSSKMLPCAEDLGTVPGCSYHVLSEYGIPGIDFQRYYKNQGGFRPGYEYRLNSAAVCSTHDSSFWVNWWQFEAGTIDEKLFDMSCEKAGIHPGHVKYCKKILFDKKRSKHGRLFWNDEITSPQLAAEILGAQQDSIHSILYAYAESYREKEKFLGYLGFETDINGISTDLVKKCMESINHSNSIFSLQLIQDYLSLDTELLHTIGKYNYRINTPGSVSRNNWSQLMPLSLEELKESAINEPLKQVLMNSKRA
ncbi:MAG TPA: 4-alpha-glucanotransferase [Ignavibacteria bacterium]|nr:4-alpha-glucanotransferase [Ignavibacteria bacterium]HMQ99245.1 4-alpha-glucanotransferase [Ignavibacteria bacterium]